MFKKGLISIVFIAIFLGGCISPTTPTSEPITFSVLYNDRVATPFRTDWRILEEYKTRQNVLLDVRLGDDADYEKAVIHALESGDIPDIILKVWPNPIESYANAGVLLPFSDYENQMPNFMAYIKEHNLQGELDKLRLDNGKYYILPGYQRPIQVQQWIYRRDVFKANHMAAPTTYDELFDSLVTLKQLYPDSTPLSTLWGGAHLFAMMGAGYGIPAGWAGTRYYNVSEDHWQFAPATENYQAMLSFLNHCYEAGILDPAMFTQSDEEFYTKIQDGRAFVTVTWISSGFANWDAKLKENGFPDGEWAPLPVPESTIGIKALPAVDPFRKGLIVPARVVNEPYFEDLLKFLDWAVYSEEGRTLTTWGIEGLTYENTPNGKNFLPDIVPDEYGLSLLFNLVENEEYTDLNKPAEIAAFLERSLNAKETLEISPQLQLDAQSIEAIRIINEKLEPYAAEMSTKFITGEMDINMDWDAYILELDSRGYKTLEIIWNDAWQKQNQ
ncbi:MAG: extracellular solute-binding protein [Chloroflexi bacterium]|nr:extracellular solute-binding protein [Chloroflexota bacterium]